MDTIAVPVAQPAPLKLEGQTNKANEESDSLDVNAIIQGLIGISLNITMMVAVVVLLSIVIVSAVNLIILGILAVTAKKDSDMIYKDTLKYKILRYVDYINEKRQKKEQPTDQKEEAEPSQTTSQSFSFFGFFGAKKPEEKTGETSSTPVAVVVTETTTTQQKPPTISEPYFFIYGGIVNMLSLIYICYMFLLIICILAGIIYIAFAYFVKIMYKDFKVNTDGDSKIISTLLSYQTFIGIIVAALLGIFHWAYFENVIYPALNEIKSAVYRIDSIINAELTKSDTKFNTELFGMLSKKSKGIDDFAKYKPYIEADIKTRQLDKAKQKIVMIILYSHLHDEIPDTNKRAHKLIDYYFVKNPLTQADKLDIWDLDQLNDLTFISLLVESTGIQRIDQKYIDYDFYSNCTSGDSSDVEKIKSDVHFFFRDLNNELVSFPEFKSNIDLFAWYFVIFFVASFILVFVFMKIISNFQSKLSPSIHALAGNISTVMTRIAPPLAEVTENIIPFATNLYPEDADSTGTEDDDIEDKTGASKDDDIKVEQKNKYNYLCDKIKVELFSIVLLDDIAKAKFLEYFQFWVYLTILYKQNKDLRSNTLVSKFIDILSFHKVEASDRGEFQRILTEYLINISKPRIFTTDLINMIIKNVDKYQNYYMTCIRSYDFEKNKIEQLKDCVLNIKPKSKSWFSTKKGKPKVKPEPSVTV